MHMVLDDVVLTEGYFGWDRHVRRLLSEHLEMEISPKENRFELGTIVYEHNMLAGQITVSEVIEGEGVTHKLTLHWNRGFVLTTGSDEQPQTQAEAEAWLGNLIATAKSARLPR